LWRIWFFAEYKGVTPLLPYQYQTFLISIQRLLVYHRKTINNRFGLEHNVEARRIPLLDTVLGSVKKN